MTTVEILASIEKELAAITSADAEAARVRIKAALDEIKDREERADGDAWERGTYD